MDRWLEHLRHDDLALLERATGRRAGPGQVEALLADPAAYQAVFIPHGDPFLRASPFLMFALAVHRTAADLEASSFVPEWSGPGGGSPSSTPPPCAGSWPPRRGGCSWLSCSPPTSMWPAAASGCR